MTTTVAAAIAVCDTPDQIRLFCLISLKGSLRLELVGMKRRGHSAFSVARREFGGQTRKEVMQNVHLEIERVKDRLNGHNRN